MVWQKTEVDRPRDTVRLSWAQKRDLFQILAAGACSSGLIFAIILLPPVVPTEVGASAGILAAASPPPPVTVISTELTAPVSVPVLRAAPRPGATLRASRTLPSSRLARAEAKPVQARSPMKLSKRLGRLVTGDGQYTVRPCPTVPELER